MSSCRGLECDIRGPLVTVLPYTFHVLAKKQYLLTSMGTSPLHHDVIDGRMVELDRG
jgi:hypothetical protein